MERAVHAERIDRGPRKIFNGEFILIASAPHSLRLARRGLFNPGEPFRIARTLEFQLFCMSVHSAA